MGHTAVSALSMLTSVTELHPSSQCNRGSCTKNLRAWLRGVQDQHSLKICSQHSENCSIRGIQICQLCQRWYLRRNCARQGIAQIPKMAKCALPFESFGKLHTTPAQWNTWPKLKSLVPLHFAFALGEGMSLKKTSESAMPVKTSLSAIPVKTS